MEKIKEFLIIGSGSGSGDGDGYGYGSGSGYGYGYGYGYGDGYGSGYGYGDGYGYGYGYGDGYGYDVSSYNNNNVYSIDGVPTVIEKAKGNLAKGFILNDDLTTTPCYIAKGGNFFAHGETLEKARKALRNKMFEEMDEEERIDMFLEEFNLSDRYPAKSYFDWHNRLTGSCEMGRMAFIRNHDIDLESDSFTVKEFCELCKNAYGGDVIEKIIERIEKCEKS